jgi:ribosomal protein S18 acetylase RimI-like enzyme
MPQTKFTTFTVRTDILQGIGWATISEHLGFRSVGAWLTSLAEERHRDFANAGSEAAQRKRELYLLSEEERREKPLKVNVRRAYRFELDRLYNLALSTPELQPGAFRVFMDKAEFNRWLFEASDPETATLVAERRSRILGFLFATIEKRSARLVFLAVCPECRRRGIGTALYEALRGALPSGVTRVGAYVPVDSPAVTFLEKLGFIPGKSFVWMDRYA